MGSLQQICLKWNNHQINFPKVFDLLLQNSDLVDVTLACDGQKLKAHKVVLSACSPYFHSLFQENPCKHPIVVFRDIKYNELQSIIEFMYKGEVNVPRDELSDFIRTAQALQVKGIAEEGNEECNPKLKSTPNFTKKKSPPPLMPSRKPFPSMSHSNNIQMHPAKKPRLREFTPSTSFRESPSSMFREINSSSFKENAASASPFRENLYNNVSFTESMNSLLKENSISNHQVPTTSQINLVTPNSLEDKAPVRTPEGSESEAVKLEMKDSDNESDGDSELHDGHGIDLLMESTMETGDEHFIVGEPPPPDDEYSQSDDGMIAPFDESGGAMIDTGPSTSTSFTDGHLRKPRKSEIMDDACTPLVEGFLQQLQPRTLTSFRSHPRVRSRRRYKNWTEETMQEAVAEVVEKGLKILPTAIQYGIPEKTLWDRVRKFKAAEAVAITEGEQRTSDDYGLVITEITSVQDTSLHEHEFL